MSALTKFASYYQDNPNLCGAVPFDAVWFDTVPNTKTFPYTSVFVISESVPNWVTDESCMESTVLQVSIFSQSAVQLDNIAETYKANLDWATISSDTTSMIRTGGGLVRETEIVNSGPPVYHRYLEYTLTITRPTPPRCSITQIVQ